MPRAALVSLATWESWRSVGPVVGHPRMTTSDDGGLDGNLNVVADDAEPRPLVAISGHRDGQRIRWSGVASISTGRRSRRRICSFSVSIFSLPGGLVSGLQRLDGSCRSAVSSSPKIARDALLDLRHAPLHLGAREVLSRVVTALNLPPSIVTLA